MAYTFALTRLSVCVYTCNGGIRVETALSWKMDKFRSLSLSLVWSEEWRANKKNNTDNVEFNYKNDCIDVNVQ